MDTLIFILSVLTCCFFAIKGCINDREERLWNCIIDVIGCVLWGIAALLQVP